MKPLNLDNRPCSPISSNCVIWQGPDIPCIKLCTGDTVSDVVYKLGTELCTIMEELKVSNYDLSCLNLNACPPEDFKALIQLLINKICELNGIPTGTDKSAGCPDCVVSVAPCFVQGTITTMQLVDYVQMIANRVCSIVTEIDSINSQITTINSTLVDLQYQIDNLPTYTLPSFPVNCILPPGNQSLDVIVQTLMNDSSLGYCRLLGATGNPSDINAAVLSQCIGDLDQPLAALALDPPVVSTFSAYYSGSWVNAAALGASPSVANTIKNIWVAVCDMYNYVSSLDTGITVQDTTTVNLTYTSGTLSAAVQDTGWHCLNGFDHYTVGSGMTINKPQVRRIGNVLHFRGYAVVPLDSATAPGNVVDFLYKGGTNTYEGTSSGPASGSTPFQGTGGMTILGGGGLQFNKGNSVIPLAVLPAGYTLDGGYSTGIRVALRQMDTGSCSTALTTMTNIAITASGSLVWGTFCDAEESIVAGCNPGAWSTSHLNYIISHVTEGQKVTDFKISAATYASPVATNPLNVYSSALAVGNQTAQPYFKSDTYPITIDANNPNHIGGFQVILDGLTAFIGPCVTTIPTPVLDANACAGTCPVG